MKPHILAAAALAAAALADASAAQTLNPMLDGPAKVRAIPYRAARLEPATRRIVEDLDRAHAPPPWYAPPAQVRANFEAFFGSLNLPPLDIVARENRVIPGPNGEIPIRIYRPRRPAAARPLLVYYHGGGMIGSSTDTYDSILQTLCAEADIDIVSVDYRLAPEHRFPQGVDDAYAGLLWAHAHAGEIGADPSRLAVGGDSAGGYLTAVVTQLSRDRGGPRIRRQVMIYPAVGVSGKGRSADLYARGYFFSKEELAWTYAQYVSDSREFSDPRVQPILAKSFANLPPALVVLAEYDILRDDALEYARRLRRDGVPADVKIYPGVIHAFLEMGAKVPAARKAISFIAADLRRTL